MANYIISFYCVAKLIIKLATFQIKKVTYFHTLIMVVSSSMVEKVREVTVITVFCSYIYIASYSTYSCKTVIIDCSIRVYKHIDNFIRNECSIRVLSLEV